MNIPAKTTAEQLARLKGVVRPRWLRHRRQRLGRQRWCLRLAAGLGCRTQTLQPHPRARVVGMATAGVAPRIMGIGPAPATQELLARLGWSLDSLDTIELNEAFAAQGLAVLRQLGLPTMPRT